MSHEDLSPKHHTSPFDTIRQVNKQGNEYWNARDLFKILGYTEWRNAHNTAIKRAMKACEENRQTASDHFVQSYKAIHIDCRGKVEVVTHLQPYRICVRLNAICDGGIYATRISI